MSFNRTVWSAASIILFISVLLILRFQGGRSRVFAPASGPLEISSPQEAFHIWQDRGVKGRILLLFDEYPHLPGRYSYKGGPHLTSSNLVEFSLFQNIIRKIYLIVPDEEWVEFIRKDTLRPIRGVAGLQRGVYLYSLNGLPIIATTPSSLPQLGEDPLVYINSSLYGPGEVLALLSERKIRGDITVIYRPTDE